MSGFTMPGAIPQGPRGPLMDTTPPFGAALPPLQSLPQQSGIPAPASLPPHMTLPPTAPGPPLPPPSVEGSLAGGPLPNLDMLGLLAGGGEEDGGLEQFSAETQADGTVLLRRVSPDGMPGPVVSIVKVPPNKAQAPAPR